MRREEYISLPELAKILGISRIAVYKKVKKGEIPAQKIGRNYALNKRYLANILGKKLSGREKKVISAAVAKTVKEYGEVLKMLGRE